MQRCVPPRLLISPLISTSTVPTSHTLLWRAHRSTRRHCRRPRRLPPPRAVFFFFLSSPHAPADGPPKSSKISNALSFFPIKDASGTAQLVVRRNKHDAQLASLSHVPLESSVLIQGRVSERPEKDRRPVRTPSPLPSLSSHVPSLAPVTSRFRSTHSPSSTLPLPRCPFTPPTIRPLSVFSHTRHSALIVPPKQVNDELRARFRHLDLRRTALANNIRQRSNVSRLVRDSLHAEGACAHHSINSIAPRSL